MKQIKSPFELSFSLYLNPPIDRTIHVRVPRDIRTSVSVYQQSYQTSKSYTSFQSETLFYLLVQAAPASSVEKDISSKVIC